MFFTNPESTNLHIFVIKFYVLFFRGLHSVFFAMINSYFGIFDLNLKLLPCRKTKAVEGLEGLGTI